MKKTSLDKLKDNPTDHTLPQRWEDAGHPADNALPVVKTKPPVELKSQAESIRYQEKLAKGKGK